MAENNRQEIEAVLLHYKNDSLKLKAATFLIENMPYYYSFEGEEQDSLYAALKQFCDFKRYDKERFGYLCNFPYGKLRKVFDIQTITAEYLIENIDYSFRVWHERPWGKHISFDDFCEFILPYRIKNEPLTHWKMELHKKYTPILDSLYQGTDVVEACTRLNHYLNNLGWNYTDEFRKPHLTASYLEKMRVGDCEDMSDYAVYIMRAVGLPVVKDTYFYSPANLYGHSWNAILDTTGVMISFFNQTADPQRGKQIPYYRGKVYRYCYALQRDRISLLNNGFHVPSSLTNFSLKDVSEDYFPTEDISVDCDYLDIPSGHPVWMAVFSPHGWIPIGMGKHKGGKAHFQHIEAGFFYVVLYYDTQGKAQVAGPAFKLEPQTNEIVQLHPQGNNSKLVLKRKYPISKYRYTFQESMKGGRLEASNRSDFKDADILYQIKEIPDVKYHEIPINSAKKYRYVRYFSDTNNPVNLAELAWYGNRDNSLLNGKLIHSRPKKNTKEFTPENIQDGDRLTYFNTADAAGWIGLDLGIPHTISHCIYMPRNDDNFIRPGDTYELFYLANRYWKSLGQKVAEMEELVYDNAPEHALFWLRNLTRGKEEQVFTYHNGKQLFNLQEIIY